MTMLRSGFSDLTDRYFFSNSLKILFWTFAFCGTKSGPFIGNSRPHEIPEFAATLIPNDSTRFTKKTEGYVVPPIVHSSLSLVPPWVLGNFFQRSASSCLSNERLDVFWVTFVCVVGVLPLPAKRTHNKTIVKITKRFMIKFLDFHFLKLNILIIPILVTTFALL